MKDRNYALVFFIVLCIVFAGAFVAIFTIVANIGRPIAQLGTSAPTSALIPPTPASMLTAIPGAPTTVFAPQTPAPPLITESPATVFAPPTPAPPTATPTLMVPTPTPTLATPTLTPTSAAPVLPTPLGSYAYQQLSSPRSDLGGGCPSDRIYGYVFDVNGNPLEGVRLRIWDEWGNKFEGVTKGGAEIGYYDFIVGSTPNTWYLVVINGAGNPISNRATVQHTGIPGEDIITCPNRVDWQQVR